MTRIAALRLIAYEFEGAVDRRYPLLELTFDDGRVELFEPGGDGEVLRVRPEPWEDVFAEPLSDENREWVRTAGKHVALDASNEAPYSTIVGRPITATEDVMNTRGRVVGRVLRMDSIEVRILVEADELSVFFDGIQTENPQTPWPS